MPLCQLQLVPSAVPLCQLELVLSNLPLRQLQLFPSTQSVCQVQLVPSTLLFTKKRKTCSSAVIRRTGDRIVVFCLILCLLADCYCFGFVFLVLRCLLRENRIALPGETQQ